MHTLPFSEARAHLAEALSALDQGGEPVMISRRTRFKRHGWRALRPGPRP